MARLNFNVRRVHGEPKQACTLLPEPNRFQRQKTAVWRRQLCNPPPKLRPADSCDAAMHGNLPFLDRRCRRRRCKSGPTPACLGALGRRTQMRLGSACRKPTFVHACLLAVARLSLSNRRQKRTNLHTEPPGQGQLYNDWGRAACCRCRNGAKCYRLCCQRRQRFGNRRQRAFSYPLHLSFSVCPCHDPKQWLLH